MSEAQRIKDGAAQLEQIAARAIMLYSRPTIAMEVVRLTEEPQVDTRALKECIENDPALTGKILRVVNSSLFGLSSQVADLNQALALLGIKPLKLLVLGFSLPDELFTDVAAKQLQWYWTNTLTRAVAARLLSEQLWHQSGDEPFIGGLLEDLGILAMLRELGSPYVKFLSGVIEERCHLAALERATLGFDHAQLSAALLTRWHLPQKLIDAVAAPRQIARLARLSSPDGDLPQILHLAELMAQLVGQRRIRVLPELLEAGEAYCQLTKPQLTELIMQLQPPVDQLAEVLSLELGDARDYAQILREAHEQMGVLSEDIVAQMRGGRSDEDAYGQLRQQADELSNAMQSFLSSKGSAGQAAGNKEQNTGPTERGARRGGRRAASPPLSLAPSSAGNSTLTRKLLAAASRCRQHRQELSLLLVEAHEPDTAARISGEEAGRRVRRALGRACASIDSQNVTLLSLGDRRSVAILCNCERRAALATVHQTIKHLDASGDAAKGAVAAVRGAGMTLSAGVATAAVVPKNFEPARLIESAERCLAAAGTSGISAVKSIEV